MDYDAIIIGSGCGGSAAGAALAGSGFKVLVLERMERVGGRCTTMEKEGFKVDIGSHIVMRSEYGPFEEALKRVDMGGKVKFHHIQKQMIQYQDMKFVMNVPKMMKLFQDLMPTDMLKMAGQMLPMMTGFMKTLSDQFNYISTKEFVERYTDSLAVRDLVNHMGFICTWTPYWETSTGEMINIMLEAMGDMMRAMGDGVMCMGYPIGGLISYPAALCEGIRNKGGEVLTDADVKRVIVEDGKVKGVEMADGTVHKSSIVVSNAGIKETVLELVGREHFDAEYADGIEALRPSWAVYCLRLALDRKVMDIDGAFTVPDPDVEKFDRMVWEEHEVPEDILPPLMITSPSNMDPSLAPEGKQLVVIIGGCSYEPAENWPRWEARALESANSTFPGLKDHIIWKDFLTPATYGALGEWGAPLIGIGQTYDQVGEKRPSSKSPVDGLFYAGCEAGRGVSGIGMELGTLSGIKCADYIVQNVKVGSMTA
ncbi:MAG: NAD(P)/FAD-dependent oxidoreductase [Actinobacteria bacterium]|nr:NAD(P)/FAD-dependent oxidoreductase [Actinomycetota bacterium]